MPQRDIIDPHTRFWETMMRIIDNYRQMRQHLPKSSCAMMLEIVTDLGEFIDGAIDQASFTKLVGGPVYLIEDIDELDLIRSPAPVRGRSLSLLQAESAWFDIAEWTADKKYARFVIIESSEGGPQYFVPRAIAETTSNVLRSIELTAARNTG